MESLRQQALQAELKRIEAEAEAHSYAIMNRADQLAAAHALCARINEGLEPSQRVKPSVAYFSDNTCGIFIQTYPHSDVIVKRLADLGLNTEISEEREFNPGARHMTVDGVPGVKLILRQYFFAPQAAA